MRHHVVFPDPTDQLHAQREAVFPRGPIPLTLILHILIRRDDAEQRLGKRPALVLLQLLQGPLALPQPTPQELRAPLPLRRGQRPAHIAHHGRRVLVAPLFVLRGWGG